MYHLWAAWTCLKEHVPDDRAADKSTCEACVRVACLEAGLSRIILGMKRLSAKIHQSIHHLVYLYPAQVDERG